MTFDPKPLTTLQLLQSYSQILAELRQRKVIRTSNSPVGDYAEWLVAHKLGLKLLSNSNEGYDAIDSINIRFQIKGRRITKYSNSRQLSAIRNLQRHDFDYLIVVLFDDQFNVTMALKIPHEIIETYARFQGHVNAHILTIRDNILSDPQVENLTHLFQT